MKTFLATAAAVIVGICLLFGLGWLGTTNSLFMNKVFAPKFEQVRRDTFEQSKAYRDGAVQELQDMQFEYVKAAPEHKAALASIIKHRAAGVPADAMPADLYSFIKELP